MSPAPQTPESVITYLVQLLAKPLTVDDLAEALGVSRRTVYRYLTKLANSGAPIVASLTRPTEYRIL